MRGKFIQKLTSSSLPISEEVEVVHLVDARSPIPWIEKMSDIACQVAIYRHRVNYFTRYSFTLRLIWTELIYRRRLPHKRRLLLVAHGYRASIVASLASLILGNPWTIVHHHQPGFFEISKKLNFRIHSRIYRLTIRMATTLQALSREVVDKLLEFGVPLSRITLIGHGIREEFIDLERQKRESSETLRLLAVSRLSLEKNVERILDVCAELDKLGCKFQLKIAGNGPQFEQLYSLAQQLSISERVYFLGDVEDIVKLYDEADILLHASHTESYGQVLMEAAARCTYIISTDVGVMASLSSKYSRCETWRSQDPLLCAQQILNASASAKKEFEEFSASALLDWIKKEHSWSSCLESTVRFLNRLAVSS